MKRALIAMSGGVDSSVAAARMVADGWDCVGATMRLHSGEDTGACGSAREGEAARRVAERLGFPFYLLDFSEDFSRLVMDPFTQEYERGYTPNPCILCNRTMKFQKLLDFARENRCDKVVTGHYARVVYDEHKGRYVLKKAQNLAKDQTYVLYFLTQEQLAHICFPLGEFASKEAVRQEAESYGFENARQQDSQDICFVPDGDYAAFIRRHTGRDYPTGDFVDEAGRVLGQHKGIIGYTIGQRRGLGLSLPAPLYVKEKRVAENQVLLAPEAALYSDRLVAKDFNWVAGNSPAGPMQVMAKTRYASGEAAAVVTPLPKGRALVEFDRPQRAVTPGQAVVLYDGDEVIGGGTICAEE